MVVIVYLKFGVSTSKAMNAVCMTQADKGQECANLTNLCVEHFFLFNYSEKFALLYLIKL